MRLGAGQIDEERKLAIVTAILDATRIRVAWRGQHYECRALPSSGEYSMGEVVYCRALPDNTELVTVKYSKEVLYFSPGINGDGYAGELYKWRGGDNLVEFVWSTPNSDEYITALAYTKITNRLYIMTFVHNIWDCRIYEMSLTDELPVEKLLYVPLFYDNAFVDPCIDVAEQGGLLYLHHGGYSWHPYLMSYDPLTDGTALIQSTDLSDSACFVSLGGVAAMGEAGELCWSDGRYFYAPTCGAIDLMGGYTHQQAASNLVYDVASNQVYVCHGNSYSGPPRARTWYQRLGAYDGAAYAEEISSAVATMESEMFYGATVWRKGAIRNPYCAEWGYGITMPPEPSYRDPDNIPNWVDEGLNIGNWPTYSVVSCQGMTSFRGELLMLLVQHLPGRPSFPVMRPDVAKPAGYTATVQLIRRKYNPATDTYAWETVPGGELGDKWPYITYNYCACMTVANTSLKVHEQ